MAYYPFAPEVGATYTLSNAGNGATAMLNDYLHPLNVGMVTDITGLESPEVRESAQDMAQADGGAHGHFYFGRRPIIITALLDSNVALTERNIKADRLVRAATAIRNDAILSWEPQSRNENILANPKLTNNATLWSINSSVGGTLGTNGRAAMPDNAAEWGWRVNYTNPDTTNREYGMLVGPTPVTPGKTYSAAADIYPVDNSTQPTPHRVELRWFNDAEASMGISAGTSINVTTGTRGRPTVTAVAPAGATKVRVQGGTFTGSLNDVIDVYWTNMRLVEGSGSTAYVDGDTAGYYWSGVAGSSTSGDFIEMFTTVRLNGPIQQSGGWAKTVQIPLVSEYATLQSVGLQSVSAAGAANVTVENRGSWPATPILRITGPSAMNPTITNTAPNPDTVLRTTGSLLVASGETLEIDTLNHSAVFTAGARNGQSGNKFIDFGQTTWPLALTGNNTYQLSGTGTLTVNWRDTWA